MAKEAVAETPKKNPSVSRFKKAAEEAEALAKRARAQVKSLREGGRFGRAVGDTGEAALGGLLAGAVDGAGLVIPIGEEKTYAWIYIQKDDKNVVTYLNSAGVQVLTLDDAAKGTETQVMSIPVGLPVGLGAVAAGAYWEQADALEVGKGMVAYSVGRMGADAARAVRELMSA